MRIWSNEIHKIAREIVSQHDLPSQRCLVHGYQTRHITYARQEFMWRLRHELKLTLEEIGSILRVCHSTVHHGLRKHRRRMWIGQEKVPQVPPSQNNSPTVI